MPHFTFCEKLFCKSTIQLLLASFSIRLNPTVVLSNEISRFLFVSYSLIDLLLPIMIFLYLTSLQEISLRRLQQSTRYSSLIIVLLIIHLYENIVGNIGSRHNPRTKNKIPIFSLKKINKSAPTVIETNDATSKVRLKALPFLATNSPLGRSSSSLSAQDSKISFNPFPRPFGYVLISVLLKVKYYQHRATNIFQSVLLS